MYTGRMTRDNYVLDLAQARRGYALNRLLGSLMDPANRKRFGADEAAYCTASSPPAMRPWSPPRRPSPTSSSRLPAENDR